MRMDMAAVLCMLILINVMTLLKIIMSDNDRLASQIYILFISTLNQSYCSVSQNAVSSEYYTR